LCTSLYNPIEVLGFGDNTLCKCDIRETKDELQVAVNTELTIHALDQVHCWDAYFRLRIGHYENFTPLNFQPLLFSKQ
jgi:hypothetical protein